MIRIAIFAAALLAGASTLHAALAPEAAHCGSATGEDPHGEHRAALGLFTAEGATHRAARSGDWSEAATWAGAVPGAGAKVFVPAGVTVRLSRALEPALAWMRVEGALTFATDADTRLRVATLLVTETGRLQIGSATARIARDHTARIEFTPRTDAERAADPFDISGGLVSLGAVDVYGTDYQAFALPSRPLTGGSASIAFDRAPRGWKSGDELLFPASLATATDERRTIAAISSDGRTVTLSAPLTSDHGVSEGIKAAVPVGNLTRNVVFTSADPAQRGHTMFMTHEGVHLSGAAFRGLGRTTVERIHTLTDKDTAGKVRLGDNPIGRYPVHFHLRQGACAQREPLVFSGNAIVDGPKHGLVNHGGNVLAENNVTFDLGGSHFFSENGSEIGAFRGNLAVYSRGSGETIRAREAMYDFGHGGHGFWAQSPAVVIEGNYAFHHADAAYSIFPRPVLEFGQSVYFDARNRDPRLADKPAPVLINPGAIPFRFADNVAGNCNKGLELWNVNTYATGDEPSLVTGCQFWQTPGGSIRADYTANTRIQHCTLIGDTAKRYGTAGIGINTSTKFLFVDDVSIAGFAIGVEIPRRGVTTVSHCRLDNTYNTFLRSPVQRGRRTSLIANEFKVNPTEDFDYYLAPLDYAFNGDFSLLTADDLLYVEDARFPGKTVYWEGQHPSAVPFPDAPLFQLKGLNAATLWARYGLAVAGSIAPADAARAPRTSGVVGTVSPAIARAIQKPYTFADHLVALAEPLGEYTRDQNGDRVRIVRGQRGEEPGWRLVTKQVDGRLTSTLTYVDTRGPRYVMSEKIKLQIHPEDVRYGLELCGILHDEVAGQPTIKNLITCFKDLKVEKDGYVNVDQCCKDAVGNEVRHRYRFRVTTDAPRRGGNIGYYNQCQFASALPSSGVHAAVWWAAWGFLIALVLTGQRVVRAHRLAARSHS